MVRLNITLPDEIAKKLESKPNKSRFIAEAVNEKIQQEQQKQMKTLLLEGYKTTSQEDVGIKTDWEKTETENWS